MNNLSPQDEVVLVRCHDPIPVQKKLEGKVEAFGRFRWRQSRRCERDTDSAIFPSMDLFGEQAVDCAEFASFEVLNHLIQPFHCAASSAPVVSPGYARTPLASGKADASSGIRGSPAIQVSGGTLQR